MRDEWWRGGGDWVARVDVGVLSYPARTDYLSIASARESVFQQSLNKDYFLLESISPIHYPASLHHEFNVFSSHIQIPSTVGPAHESRHPIQAAGLQLIPSSRVIGISQKIRDQHREVRTNYTLISAARSRLFAKRRKMLLHSTIFRVFSFRHPSFFFRLNRTVLTTGPDNTLYTA